MAILTFVHYFQKNALFQSIKFCYRINNEVIKFYLYSLKLISVNIYFTVLK